MGGYTLGQADLLRRAMGKKDKAEMAKQQARFVDGAIANGVSKEDAVYIFELVDKFAGYGFNKSHAAAYALVSYQTAYLKAHFREEFLAASMTLDMGNTDKLAMFAGEAKKSGIAVLPPCVNASGVDFGAEPPKAGAKAGAIRYSLAALKNIGAGAVESIVGERDANGPYQSLADFADRLDPKALNKRAIETLAKGGAFDALNSQPCARRRQCRYDPGAGAAPIVRQCNRHLGSFRRREQGARPRACARRQRGRRWSAWRRNSRRSASICPAIRSISTTAC